jgi:hypothetical protein
MIRDWVGFRLSSQTHVLLKICGGEIKVGIEMALDVMISEYLNHSCPCLTPFRFKWSQIGISGLCLV